MISPSPSKAVIVGCEGLRLSAREMDLFANERPLGLILFGRNVENAAQLRALTASFRQVIDNPKALVLIDQEGGRVQRLAPPNWPQYEAMGTFGDHFNQDPHGAKSSLRAAMTSLALDLRSVGVNANCAPVVDLRLDGADPVIGMRAFSSQASTVAQLGEVAAQAMKHSGVLPIIKHAPGYGRVNKDPHFDLPLVDVDLETLEATDFVPFKSMLDWPMWMVAHMCFSAIDAEIVATHDPKVLKDLIRMKWGYEGLLISDDIEMQALKGTTAERSERAWQAGMDIVLHCSGRFDEMGELFCVAPQLSASQLTKLSAISENFSH